MQPLLELREATVGFEERNLLENFSISFSPAELVALVGPNGSGKSTLIKTLLGLLPLKAGERVSLATRIGYVPQKLFLNQTVPISLGEFFRLKGPQSSLKALEIFESIGLNRKLLGQKMSTLSGGEMQLALAIFALSDSPQVIAFDEVTDGIDSVGQERLLALLKMYIQETGAAVLWVSHDITSVTSHATRVLCLGGQTVFDGTPRSSDFHDCLHKVYGEKSLIHAHTH